MPCQLELMMTSKLPKSQFDGRGTLPYRSKAVPFQLNTPVSELAAAHSPGVCAASPSIRHARLRAYQSSRSLSFPQKGTAMTNLTQAHKELFRRSPDERFESLEALAQHCQQQREKSTDRWHRPKELIPNPFDHHLELAIENDGTARAGRVGRGFAACDHFHDDICSWRDRLRRNTFDDLLNGVDDL